MRTTHRQQLSFPIPAVPHKHARLLASMSAILDTIPELEEQVLSDLTADGVRSDPGRPVAGCGPALLLLAAISGAAPGCHPRRRGAALAGRDWALRFLRSLGGPVPGYLCSVFR